ncbi:LytR/AlgR family response regulator transcription factor [Planctobacterium marinum]|uniref:DNA-binding response regulator n=1 Tax=Planctobacterium marinum TaxID=1631968 RepID=A0AA48KQS2_9ALTE|nr:DNA-binding response regulator [Planctobacterium marinum]
MLNILIIEDEAPAREKLKYQLAQISESGSITEAGSGQQALTILAKTKPDVIFLDIELGDMTGFEVLDRLEIASHVIFTTAYNKFAVDAFERKALDYLLKPFDLRRLKQALSRLPCTPDAQTENQKASDIRLAVRIGDKINLLKPEQIIFMYSQDGITHAQTAERDYLLDESLESLSHKGFAGFLRIHRNALVNAIHIYQLEKWQNGNYLLRFRNADKTLTSSRQGTAKLKQYFNL